MSQTPQGSPFNAIRKREYRQQKQERNSPLLIFPTYSPPSSDNETHAHSTSSDHYSIIEHPKTGIRQKGHNLRQRQPRKGFSSPVVPPASPPTTWDDEACMLTNDNKSGIWYGVDCPACCTYASTQRSENSRPKHHCDQAAESGSELDDVESDHSSLFEVTFSPESSPELETAEQDALWQALVEAESTTQDAGDLTQHTLRAKSAACKQAIKLYPTALVPSAGTLTVNMFAPPNKTQSEWPAIAFIRQINFLHPAFTLTLYIADDELTFNITLGSFTWLFHHPCFERSAKKMISQALLQGSDSLLRVVMRLPVFAHMVYERVYMGFETQADWLPSEVELERHWMICGGHGWTCRRID